MELEEALKNLNWDILGISEMRRSGESIEEHPNYIIYNKGEIGGQRGVGFIVKLYLRNYIQDFIGISDRITILLIKIPSYKKIWSIIQVYAPTEQADEIEHKSFYNELSQILTKYQENFIIIMGDFNAQVGTKLNKDEHVLGNFGYGKRSPNGQRLVDLLLEHNLTLTNSIFQKNKNNKWTWISPDGKYKNEIDYIISSHPKFFTDTSVISKLNFNTNHRMVRSTLKTTQPKKSRIHFASPNYNADTGMRIFNTAEKLKRKIFDCGTTELRINYTELQTHLRHHYKQDNNSNKKYSLSNSTLQFIQERIPLFNKQMKKQNLEKITELSKKIREGIRRDRKTKRLQTFEKHIKTTGGTRKALKELRESNSWIPKLENKSNKHNITNRKDINRLATKFYRELYSDKYNTETAKIDMINLDLEPKILPSETRKAILSQKTDKAPGPDKITNEILKGNIDELIPILTKIFNDIMISGNIPEQWETSHITLIHKKGPRENIGNYRPISLMSNVYKIFSKIILDRITTKLDENQPIEQAGFRKNFATIDHIHTVKQVLEKYNEYNKHLYMVFIDYTKAFDNIKHEAIWESLETQGINTTFINIIRNIYSNTKARIQLETLGEEFKIRRGVRQGDPLSPKLFSAVLENIFRKLDWERLGINIDGRKLNHLRFADDIVLFEEDPHKLQMMIEDLNKESKKIGLTLNIDKTKLLTNSIKTQIEIENQPLEYVDEYIYLGQIISHEDQTTREIKRRIANGWKRYWSMKEVVKSIDISMSTKRRVFNTCVLPCITYGCETWSLSKHHRDMLQHCQRAMERSMLGFRKADKKRNTFIRAKTKVTDILTKIDQLKWRWAGHTLRSPQEKWSKTVTDWYPRDGKRKRGRQRKRWEDELKLTAGPNWRRVARDRRQWKMLEEAFAQRHTELRDIL